MTSLVLVTGSPASGKTTLAVPLARLLDLPLVSKDAIKEALFDSLGHADLQWSRRLGAASFAVMFALLRYFPVAVAEAPFAPVAGPELLAICPRPIEVFCRCPDPEVMRRYLVRAPSRHPGHLDHQMAAEIRVRLERGVGPLGLGGPLLEVDTTRQVDVAAVAEWVNLQREVV
jgi:chloramphenicol 3-O-phosphotransferase